MRTVDIVGMAPVGVENLGFQDAVEHLSGEQLVSGPAVEAFDVGVLPRGSGVSTMVFAEIYPFLRRLSWVPGAIRGVMASFTGLLASVVLVLGRPVIPVPAAIGLAAAAFVAVRVLKWSILLVFVSGLAA